MSDATKQDRRAEVEGLLERYLLGLLPEGEMAEVELRYLADDACWDALLAAEDGLCERYLRGELGPTERAKFETYFLRHPERKRQLEMTRLLLSGRGGAKRAGGKVLPFGKRISGRAGLTLKIAAGVALLAGLSWVAWWAVAGRSEVERGRAALREAYRDRRPFESRVSGFGYAPAVVYRQGGKEDADYLQKDRAERILLDAAASAPGPQTRHALGQFYLADRQYDKAVDQFEAALKAGKAEAGLYSDLGAAWLEKGKLKQNAGEPAAAAESFTRSLDYLNKSLALAPRLPEALFNRALCYQSLKLYEQAGENWRAYLEADPQSPWADEARKRLAELERRQRSSLDGEQLHREFVAACAADDRERAWSAFTLGRTSQGSLLVGRLVDEYLEAADAGGDSAGPLRRLVYAGELDRARAGDAHTSDLARYYAGLGPPARQALKAARGCAKGTPESVSRRRRRPCST